jgi:hypothetical protein
MPAVRAHASLTLNRELHAFDRWDEETIQQRGAALFEVARKHWRGPMERPKALAAESSTTAA